MIPHVRNDSRAGLGVLGSMNGGQLNGRTNGGGPVTEMSATVEIDDFEVRRSPIVQSSPDENDEVVVNGSGDIPMVEFGKFPGAR